MTQIAFVTLFLGLTLGVEPLEIRVTGPVHHVELRLDGTVVGVIAAPPWKTTIDFGRLLLPRRLTAVAMDASGRELASAEQTINVPRPSAETEILLERSGSGRPVKAHLLWQSFDTDKPKAARLTLDGAPLALDTNLTADIANADMDRPHLLRARVESRDGTVAETEIAFGALEGQTGRSLTGIPIRVLRDGAALTPATAKQWLTTPNGAPDVVGVEELPGDVIVVRDPSNLEAHGRLHLGWFAGAMTRPLAESSDAAVQHRKPQARFVWPMATAAAKKLPTHIMPLTRPFEFQTADELKAALGNVAAPALMGRLSYADAVAVAGLRAAATQRLRAVVLLLGKRQRDQSELTPREARDYLRAIGVPLFVWSLAPGEAKEWDDVTDVSSRTAFDRAFAALDESLQSQRIVWVNGDYLPGEVAVSPDGQSHIATLVSDAGGQALQGRIEVHAIEVTANVRDASRRVPRDLMPEDFVVLENGTPQKVIGVNYTEAKTPSRVVIYLEQSLSSTTGLRKAINSLASEAEGVLAAGAVEVVTDYPQPHSLFGPTRDPLALRRFLQKLADEITGEEELIRIRAAFAATDLPKDADGATLQRWERNDQIRMRAHREWTALRTREDALLGWLSRYPSSPGVSLRTLLLVSDGFDLEPASFYRLAELRTLSASPHHEQIARALSGEHWTVLSLAMAESPHAASPTKFPSRIGAPEAPTSIAPLNPVNRSPLAPLSRLADATGGDVATDVQNVGTKVRELSDRIVITYQTERPADDTLRRIEITSRRPGLTIRAQKWAGNATAAAVAESIAASFATEVAQTDDNARAGVLPVSCSITLGPLVSGVRSSEVKAHVDLKPIGELVESGEQGSLAFTVAVTGGNEPPFAATRRIEHVDLAAPDGYTATIGIRHREHARIAVIATEPSTGSWGTCVVAVTP
jgi:hypothetical protein